MNAQRPISVIALSGDAKFAYYEADARLAGKVDDYWGVDVEQGVELRIVPDGRVDLIFDLHRRRAFLAGPNERPFDVKHTGATKLLGATMSPDFAAATLSEDPGAKLGAWRSLEASLGPFARELIERIASARDGSAQVATLETFLLARAGAADRRVARAIAEIRRSGGSVGVAALGRSSGASPRHLARLFDHWVGMTPKTFARIARVQQAMRRMRETPPPHLKALATELGFADQAHLSREMKAMTGASPGRMAEIFKSSAEIFKPHAD